MLDTVFHSTFTFYVQDGPQHQGDKLAQAERAVIQWPAA